MASHESMFTNVLGNFRWRAAIAALFLFNFSFFLRTSHAAPPTGAELAGQATIYRDKFGVPHIDGPTNASVIFGFAYAQAEDFFWQVEDSYIQAIGRYAEINGEAGMENDLFNRVFEIVPKSKADYEKGAGGSEIVADSFTAGLNYYLEKHPEVKPRLITHFEPWMALAQERNVLMTFLYSQVHYPKGHLRKLEESGMAVAGSNGWAIGPTKTKDKHAMLYCNPHQPWFGFGQFYEGHLHSAEGINFQGCALIAMPLLTIGHNEHLGWSHTVNEPDVADVWKETFDDPKNPLNYKYDAGYKTATEWKENVKIPKGGSPPETSYTFRKTQHGPVTGSDPDGVH